MGILNYTTTVSADRSISDIQKLLAKAGARRVMHEYDEQGFITSLIFQLEVNGSQCGFRLPTDWRPILPMLEEIRRKNTRLSKSIASQEQAVNVAWRITKDWVEAQIAIIEAHMAKTEQVFLPYLMITPDKTLYEEMQERHFQLGSGNG